MARAAKNDRWLSGKEATAILNKNSGRTDIKPSYIRSLARIGKVDVREVDGRTNEYKASDVEKYVVERKNKGKGDTKAARAAGSRRKHIAEAC